MNMKLFHMSLALMLGLVSTSCFPSPKFEMKEREMSLRYSSENDELLMFEVLRDIRIDEDEFWALEGLARGERVFLPEDGFFTLRIDEELEKYHEVEAERLRDGGEQSADEAFVGDLLGLADRIKVLEAGLFGEDGTINFYRLSRMGQAGEVCAFINDTINMNLRKTFERNEEAEEPADLLEFLSVELSEETSALWKERAVGNGAWVSLGEDGFSADLPLESREATAMVFTMATLLAKQETDLAPSGEGNGPWAWFWMHLSDLEITEDHLVVQFQPLEDGYFKLPLDIQQSFRRAVPGSEEHDKGLAYFKGEVGFVGFDVEALFKRFELSPPDYQRVSPVLGRR